MKHLEPARAASTMLFPAAVARVLLLGLFAAVVSATSAKARAEDDPQCAEAREWLRARRNPSALATNRFGATAEALKFVEQLYAEGASCVIVDHIEMVKDDQGEPYADELIVVFPNDARRKAIFDLIEHEGRPDTIDDEHEIIDQGRGSARLWWA